MYNGSIQIHTGARARREKIAYDACSSHLLIEMSVSFARLHAGCVLCASISTATNPAAATYVRVGVYARESSFCMQPMFTRVCCCAFNAARLLRHNLHISFSRPLLLAHLDSDGYIRWLINSHLSGVLYKISHVRLFSHELHQDSLKVVKCTGFSEK